MDLGDGLKLNIISFFYAKDKHTAPLSDFFKTHCWKDPAIPDEKFFHDKMFNIVNANDRPAGDYIYVTDADNNIIFAQLAIIKDTRPDDGNELFLELMGSCTHTDHRRKGLFKKVLDALVIYYKTVKRMKVDRHSGRFDAIKLTANYKNRNGVTAKIRHKTFSKAGLSLNAYINEIKPYFVKTEDGKFYYVVGYGEIKDEMKPVSHLEAVVMDGEEQKKIPVETIVGCYLDEAGSADSQVECPFSLYFYLSP